MNGLVSLFEASLDASLRHGGAYFSSANGSPDGRLRRFFQGRDRAEELEDSLFGTSWKPLSTCCLPTYLLIKEAGYEGIKRKIFFSKCDSRHVGPRAHAIIDLGGWARTGSEAAWQLASSAAYLSSMPYSDMICRVQRLVALSE